MTLTPGFPVLRGTIEDSRQPTATPAWAQVLERGGKLAQRNLRSERRQTRTS